METSTEIDGTFESLHEGAATLMHAFSDSIKTVYRVTIDCEPIIFEHCQATGSLYVEDDRAANMGMF